VNSPSLCFDFPQPLRFENPLHIITAYSLAEVRPALSAVQNAADSGLYAAGYVAYEAAPAFDPAIQVIAPDPSLPLVWFGIFSEPAPSDEEPFAGAYSLSEWAAEDDYEHYESALHSIREKIAAGDVYQVNQTFRLNARFQGDPRGLYHHLCGTHPPIFPACLEMGRHCLLSASPELFFHRDGEHILTRPMKGTRRRGRWQEEDDLIAAELAASEKDRAENVMIVDLLRNDLGRLSVPGSVQVPQLFEIERHATVWQMTSTIEAQLRPRTSLEEIFTALFPCGSVTGAPKISAAHLITRHEISPRGIYCGAVGYLTPYSEAVFNVAIRTAWIDKIKETIQYGIGGGIVWDSIAEAEYQEAWTKARLITECSPAFDLLETLRWENGAYALLDRHITRLLASAAYFGFNASEEEIRDALQAHSCLRPGGSWRVRLCVSAQGKPTIESAPLDIWPSIPQAVALAKTPIERGDKFLCHKTTHRAVYDRHMQEQPACFDVLLWNEDGELTEFTRGNLVLELSGERWTPPRSCGLLNGTQRAELLESGELKERILRREDLETATRIWLLNSVRGLVPVQFVS
jgi:para-aminobenzoate synthetase/4-amino-4-deoxychorismate lyase